jgi:hypothetical protein
MDTARPHQQTIHDTDRTLEWRAVGNRDLPRYQPELPDRWDLEREDYGHAGIYWFLTGPDDRPFHLLVCGPESGDVRLQAAIDAASLYIRLAASQDA